MIKIKIAKVGFLLISISLLIACHNRSDNSDQISSEDEDTIQIKVAAYNVEVSRNATATEIGTALQPYNFDIICFSEAPGGEWTKNVADEMGLDHVVVGQYSTAGHDNKYKSIASRTPLYGYEEILMTDTLHTVTKANTRIQDTVISIYSVHFPFGWRDQAHIDETTAKIASFVDYLKKKQQDEIILAMGDFNFTPSNNKSQNEYHEMFVDVGLEFSWEDIGIDVTQHNTHNAFETTDKDNGNVIDHIMYNPNKMKAVKGNIIEMENPLSDHKPVWALLELK